MDLFIDHEIVQSPPDVLGPASCSHAPPRVLDLLWILVSEGVNPTAFQELTEAVAFFDGKSCRLLIAFRPGDVNLLVTDVEVSTEDHSFLLAEVVTIFLEALVPLIDSVIQAIQLLPSVWDVSCDEVKLFELHRDDPPFL